MTHFKATHEPFDYPERFNDLYKNIEIPEPASLYDFSPKTTGRSFKGQKLETLACPHINFRGLLKIIKLLNQF